MQSVSKSSEILPILLMAVCCAPVTDEIDIYICKIDT